MDKGAESGGSGGGRPLRVREGVGYPSIIINCRPLSKPLKACIFYKEPLNRLFGPLSEFIFTHEP